MSCKHRIKIHYHLNTTNFENLEFTSLFFTEKCISGSRSTTSSSYMVAFGLYNFNPTGSNACRGGRYSSGLKFGTVAELGLPAAMAAKETVKTEAEDEGEIPVNNQSPPPQSQIYHLQHCQVATPLEHHHRKKSTPNPDQFRKPRAPMSKSQAKSNPQVPKLWPPPLPKTPWEREMEKGGMLQSPERERERDTVGAQQIMRINLEATDQKKP